MKTRTIGMVTAAVLFASMAGFGTLLSQAQTASAGNPEVAAPKAAAISGRLSGDQMKAILAEADDENRRAFSDLVQQTSAVPGALVAIQDGIRQKYPRMGGTDNCRGGISELQSRLGLSLSPKQIKDIEEMNGVLMGCAGQYSGFGPPNSRDIAKSAYRAVADAKGRQQQIENAKTAILQVESALDKSDLVTAIQIFRTLTDASSLPPFAQSYVQQTRSLREELEKQEAAAAEAQRELQKQEAAAAEVKRNTPPQSLVDYVRVAVEGLCKSDPDKSSCIAKRVSSEKFKRFQFRILDYSQTPTDADYGWLTEFNVNGCETKADCLVVFTIFLKTTWQFVLQYSGNFQSISYASMIDPTGNQTASLKIKGHGIDDHTWLYGEENGLYYDYDEAEEKAAKAEDQREAKQVAQAKAEEQKARAAFRAAPPPDQNTKPITVVVEKTYLNNNIASGSPLGLWAEVRISSEDAKRLHDPVGVPKNLAWHLVPELADGRLRFAIICNPNHKDCFKLNPGKTYSLELMRQDDSDGARGNLNVRFVRVNGGGAYMVADYGGAGN